MSTGKFPVQKLVKAIDRVNPSPPQAVTVGQPEYAGGRVDSRGRRALVTGANGFVGSYLTWDLLEKGYQVRAMVRATSDLSALEGKDVEYVFGDMTDPASFPRALEGMEIIFHVAGVTKSRDPAVFALVNADGSGDLMRACRDVPSIRRFVYISSQAATGPSGRECPRREDDPPDPVSAYGRSKWGGEEACREAAGSRIALTIVRPCIVYGPREPEGLSLFITSSKGIIPAILPNTCLSLIYAADLADLIERAGRLDVAEGREYNAADPDPYWLRQVVRTIGRVIERRLFFIPVPPALLKPLAITNEILFKVGIGIGALTRELVEDATHRYWTMDVSRAHDELGWRPKSILEERVRETADWYREKGLL
jgi:nucleoside-diphosphate-sugar epimerase